MACRRATTLAKAARAIGYLQREADLVLATSNSEWASRYPNDTPMIDVFTGLDRYIVNSIQGVVHRAFQHRV